MSRNNGHGGAAAAVQHPLIADPLRSDIQAFAPTPPSRAPARRRNGHSAGSSGRQVAPTPEFKRQDSKQQKKLPRSVSWRLSLGLLTTPTAESKDNEHLLKSIEDLNALKLRCQRSRYDELEKKHYWKSTPVSIADDTNSVGGGVDGSARDAQGENMHHVAPGDDPLSSVLLHRGQSMKNIFGKAEDKKGLFGRNARANRSTSNFLGQSFTSNASSEPSEDEACKGSRWSEFYSTREVLGVIEKDLDRLPADHYKMFHQWRIGNEGLKEHRKKEEELKQRKEKGVGLDGKTGSQHSDEGSIHSAQSSHKGSITSQSSHNLKHSWTLGLNKSVTVPRNESWNLAKRVQSSENMLALLEVSENGEKPSPEQVAKAEIQASINQRAARLSQILFVYAREHPELGYRQGMHEILSYIMLALEMDLLEQSIILERKRWRKNSLSFGLPSKSTEIESGGSMAGLDSSGKIVVVRLLDPDYLLNDAFNIFECIMTSLAPAYDAIPAGDEVAASMLEKANAERGETPMEQMTSSIVAKLRFVARDEALFAHILYMPVPPQLYFAKWVRLMFGRELAGGMRDVLRLWDAFFDLASARTSSSEDTPVTIALLDVLKAAGAAMIILIRPKLLAPTLAPDGTMTGEPDPHGGIDYLMNYPPIEDITQLVETIQDLLAEENKISQQYYIAKSKRRSKLYLPTERNLLAAEDDHQLNVNVSGNQSHPLSQGEPPALPPKEDMCRNDRHNGTLQTSEEQLPQVHRTGGMKLSMQQKHDKAEFIGQIAGGLLDFGSKTASAAIASLQKQFEHPLHDDVFALNSGDARQSKQSDFVINYRPYAPVSSRQESSPATKPPCEEVDESDLCGRKTVLVQNLPVKNLPKEEDRDLCLEETVTVKNSPKEASSAQNLLEQMACDDSKDDLDSEDDLVFPTERRRSSDPDAASLDVGLNESFTSRASASKSLGDSMHLHRGPKELADTLQKSVDTLMKHFNRRLSIDSSSEYGDDGGKATSSVIPEEIWDAMAEIDSVRKELLQQDAITSLDHARSTSSLISGAKRSGQRRGSRTPSWQL